MPRSASRGALSPLLIWAASLVAVWCATAAALHQPPWVQQASRDLLPFGVIKGIYFEPAQAWRLVASQWLHVKPPHMLLNAMILGGVGLCAERRWGGLWPALVALTGGTLSQALLVRLEPQAFLSGASQAYMALCGFALTAGGIGRIGLGMAWAGVAVGVALDVFVSGHGALKVGHLFPLVFGLACGLIARVSAARRPADTSDASF